MRGSDSDFPEALASFLHFGKKLIFSGQDDGHDVVRGVRRGEDGRATCHKAPEQAYLGASGWPQWAASFPSLLPRRHPRSDKGANPSAVTNSVRQKRSFGSASDDVAPGARCTKARSLGCPRQKCETVSTVGSSLPPTAAKIASKTRPGSAAAPQSSPMRGQHRKEQIRLGRKRRERPDAPASPSATRFAQGGPFAPEQRHLTEPDQRPGQGHCADWS